MAHASRLRARHVILPGLLLLALAVRLAGLRLEPVASDDAFSWRMAQPPAGEVFWRVVADTHPPLYYLVLHCWFAVFGDSVLALRTLSLLFGVLAVAATWWLCLEASRLYQGISARAAPAAALLVAAHAGAIQASRFGRMYSLGCFLAALSAALLLRALREPGRARWTAFALAAAAFAYTHYYAFFSLAALAAFAAQVWIGRRRSDPAAAARTARGFLFAAAGAALLYTPWLPFFVSQATRVKGEYWVPPVRLEALAPLLAQWAAGLDLGGSAALALVALWSALAVWAAWCGGPGPRLLLCQAALPWMLAASVSWLGGRPLLLERYLGFAQLFLLAFWGVAWAGLSSPPARAALALVVLAPVASASFRGVVESATAVKPDAEAQAAAWVAEQARPGDVVVTDSGRAMNRLRFLLHQMGTRGLPVYAAAPPDLGERIHAPALAAHEVFAPGAISALVPSRLLWVAGKPPRYPLPGFTLAKERRFRGLRRTTHLVMVLVRAGPPPAPAAPPDATRAAHPR